LLRLESNQRKNKIIYRRSNLFPYFSNSFGIAEVVMSKAYSFCFAIGFLVSGSLFSEDINKSFFGNLAIEGYDPVAYFTEGRPVKGSSEFEFIWEDAKWRFSSDKNWKNLEKNK
jgi:hypothetical protein